MRRNHRAGADHRSASGKTTALVLTAGDARDFA